MKSDQHVAYESDIHYLEKSNNGAKIARLEQPKQ